MKSKKLLFSTLLLLGGVLSFISLTSNSTGVMGASTTGCGGGGCHSTGATTDSLIGIPNPCIAGTTYVCTLAVLNTSKLAAGFDLSVNGGTMSAAPTGTMLMGGTELHHTTPKNMTAGAAFWIFNWTAPTTPGAVVFNIAGNAVNSNGSESGDAYATAAKTFQVNFATALDPSFNENKINIYPNPVSEFAIYNAGVELQDVSFTAISLLGNVVQVPFQKINSNEYHLNLRSLTSGNYILSAKSKGHSYQTLFSKK